MNKSHELLDDYCVIDLETTGMSYKIDKIIEVGILKIQNNTIIKEFHTLVNPETFIDPMATAVNHISDEMVIGQPKIDELKDNILSFISDYPLVGHNISFDIHFLESELSVELTNPCIDTLMLSRKLFPNENHHRLTDMQQLLNLYINNHRAIDDCLCTYELYETLKNKVKNENIDYEALFPKALTKTKIDISSIKPESVHIDKDNFFYKKHCVFTGGLNRMNRKDAMQLIVNLGAILDKSVTKQTNFLILGNDDYSNARKNGKSTKHKKAEDLRRKGQDIEIIDEDTFYNLLNN